jgi:hypothetical protein
MAFYGLLLSSHIIVAVLGLGPIAALALLTKRPPLPKGVPRPMPPEAALRAFSKVLRLSQISLVLMILTGGTLMGLSHGVFSHAAWLVASALLTFFGLGTFSGVAHRNLRRAASAAGTIEQVQSAHVCLLWMCLIMAVVVWLMQAKPF